MVAQTKVFVGSLPQGSKPEELRRLFERFGEVTECDIMNRCGFVHMATEDQAEAAIRALQNATFNGALITVEKGRMKDRVQRGPGGPGGRGGGPGGPMRGGMRNGMGDMPRRPGGGGPMRGPMGGREPAPYMRDSRPPMRGPMGGGDMRGPMRNGMGGGGGYDAYPDDRYDGYGADQGRGGYGMMDRGGHVEGYGASVSVHGDMGYGAPVGGGGYPDDRSGYGTMDNNAMYADDRRAPMYPDDMMDRRGGGMRAPMGMAPAYDRGPASRPTPMGNGGDMYSRRSPPSMRGGGGGYDREPYGQQYSQMGRMGGGAAPHGGRDMGMGPRRY